MRCYATPDIGSRDATADWRAGGSASVTVKSEMAGSTGVESAPSEPPGWTQSGADLGLPHGFLTLSSMAIVA